MARKEIPFIVEDDNRDNGKEFIITEMSAWDADELAQDLFRSMGNRDSLVFLLMLLPWGALALPPLV
ncbi:hypothetical protein O5345_19420 [Escherichia coli]|nr:hypothetical protein [Escherichia coli]